MSNLTLRSNIIPPLKKYAVFAEEECNLSNPVTDIEANRVGVSFFGRIMQMFSWNAKKTVENDFITALSKNYPGMDFSHYAARIQRSGLTGSTIKKILHETEAKADALDIRRLISQKIIQAEDRLSCAQENTQSPQDRIQAANAVIQIAEEIDYCVDELKKDINGFILTQDLEQEIKTQQHQVEYDAEVATKILKELQPTRIDDDGSYDTEIPDSVFVQIGQKTVAQPQSDQDDSASEVLAPLKSAPSPSEVLTPELNPIKKRPIYNRLASDYVLPAQETFLRIVKQNTSLTWIYTEYRFLGKSSYLFTENQVQSLEHDWHIAQERQHRAFELLKNISKIFSEISPSIKKEVLREKIASIKNLFSELRRLATEHEETLRKAFFVAIECEVPITAFNGTDQESNRIVIKRTYHTAKFALEYFYNLYCELTRLEYNLGFLKMHSQKRQTLADLKKEVTNLFREARQLHDKLNTTLKDLDFVSNEQPSPNWNTIEKKLIDITKEIIMCKRKIPLLGRKQEEILATLKS